MAAFTPSEKIFQDSTLMRKYYQEFWNVMEKTAVLAIELMNDIIRNNAAKFENQETVSYDINELVGDIEQIKMHFEEEFASNKGGDCHFFKW
jgi:hypothetical protein